MIYFNLITRFIFRAKKSLVKGFLKSDIQEMSQTQSESDDPQGIEMAKALCEQKDWPLVPVSTCFDTYTPMYLSHVWQIRVLLPLNTVRIHV